MTKHIADQPRERRDDIRLRRYMLLERRRKADPSVPSLYRKARGPADGARLREFLRIERNILA